jgi:8-oxo-dGTP pyrophosphatase MutT (NUDIX family)
LINITHNHWPLTIEKALQNKLPGSNSHIKMLPPARSLSLPDESNSDIKSSGVLILLFPEENEIFICLIKRQPYMKFHAGQIGFPGGKKEKTDINLSWTAMRETSEEIGIQPAHVRILGALSPLFVPVSGFMIYPFAAWSPVKPDFVINHNEVEKLILFPLLRNIKNQKIIRANVETQTGWLEVPAFEFDNEIVWGATAMILAEFFDVLETNDQYVKAGTKHQS